MIILRNNSHGGIIRVCMGIFTTAIRNKKIRRILKKKKILRLTSTVYCLLSDRLLWRKERILASCPFRGFQRSIKTILIFRWKIFYLHLQSSSTSRKWKNSNVVRFADLVHRARRDPSVTLRKFSPDTTGHGLRITKRPAVWHFSIFLFEK